MFITIPPYRFLKPIKLMRILRMSLAIFFILFAPTEAMQRIMMLRQQQFVQQAVDLAQKATEAAQKGDFTTAKQHLSQIDALAQNPYFGAAVQNSPTVQEARRFCSQGEKDAISAAAQKAEEERLKLEREKQQEISNRIVFEKEQAQKQLTQRQEDERKSALREQQQQSYQPKVQQAVPQTPQAITHQEGKSFASSMMSGVISAAKSTNPQIIPRFATDKPKEASLKAENLGDAALIESKTNQVYQHITSSAKERPSFKFDPNTDPLFVNANQPLKNPESSLNEQITEGSGSDNITEEIKTCIEGGDEYQQTCSKRLEIKLKIMPESSSTTYVCGGHKERRGLHYSHWTCAGCVPRTTTIPKKVEVESEKWIDGCAVLEDHAQRGLCRYVSKTTSLKNETRTIQGESVTRDHFEEYYTYACFKPSQNSCAGLREQGCYQIKSICKETMGNHCVLWQQTFSCPTGKRSLKSYNSSNKNSPQASLFCLTGDCADTSYEANGELLNVMSHLYTLREAQNDLKNLGIIFKGQTRWCTRNCLDFRDCCGSANGWGVTLHLSSCDKAEIELRTLRDKNLCVQVGTYCAERDKVFNSCLRKKTTFCCYGTKLARIIQQQGRGQLGINWGTPEHPTCERGLSPEELGRIDFSQINFSEVFEDIKDKMVPKDQEQSLASVSSTRLQENMTLLTKPTQNSSDQQKQQALKEKGL